MLPALTVEGLTFQYRTGISPVIRDVGFELEAGEVVLITGGSGSGKSTLLRCLNGLVPRSYPGELAGSIRFGDRGSDGLSLSQLALLVGTVLQDPEKQIVASHVAEEVAFGPENLGWPRPRIHEAVEKALEALGIGHLRDRETFHLSGGEKQKVALAGVLAMEPGILLLDEPLASLDPRAGREAMALIRAQAGTGRTVGLVELRIEEALLAQPDRVLHLEGGLRRHWGPVPAFLAGADPGAVKLPWRTSLGRGNLPTGALPEKADAGAPVLAEFDRVGFGYGDGPAVLQEVSFTLRKGDCVAILGPNGAGKSTLMRHLIGLLRPREGRVLVGDKDTRKVTVASLAAQVGYVFQNPGHMLFAPTVREELAFGPRNLKHADQDIVAASRRALEVTGLTGTEERSPLSLSFGQQKRLGIAAVVAMGSRILVLDEPTAGQDYASQRRFMDEVCAVGGFEATVFITHDLDLALTYANRVLLVADGRLVADGPPEEVLARADLLESCHLLPTDLLALNRVSLPITGRFGGPALFAGLSAEQRNFVLDNLHWNSNV